MTTFTPPPLFSPDSLSRCPAVSPSAKNAEHRRLLGELEDRNCVGSPARLSEADRLRSELMRYLRFLGVGAAFQALDFTAWLESQSLMPDGSFDARGLGGLYVALMRHSILRRTGYAPNGGCRARNISSAARPVYVVQSLDFSPVGWSEAGSPQRPGVHREDPSDSMP